MNTRLKSRRRPSAVKVAGQKTAGVNYVPSEMSVEKDYQDLKKLKNIYIPNLDTIPIKNATKTVQSGLVDFLELDCAPPTPNLVCRNEAETQGGSLFPELPMMEGSPVLPALDKIGLVPELPKLEEDRHWLEDLKKVKYKSATGFEAPVDIKQENCFSSIQPVEDTFVSVQTKKAFSRRQRATTVKTVPTEDLGRNFVQHELRQQNHFVPGTVQYTTKKALEEFVDSLPKLTSGTHGCMVEEGYIPDAQEYLENSHYVTVRRLGCGSFGNVDLALDSVSKKELVRKQIKKDQLQKGEIIIPLNLNNRHVTKIIGLIQRQNETDIKMELFLEYAGRALNVYLIKEGNNLTPDQIWKLTKQALEGLTHIHKYGMIHLDIKPENICVREVDDGLELKITDFGSAKLSYDEITFNGWTPEYMAPESCQYFLQVMHNIPFGLTSQNITGKVDVFALSLVIGYMYGKKHVLLSLITQGQGSYHGLTQTEKSQCQTQLILMMASTGPNGDALINDKCDIDMRELLMKMSSPMANRVTAREALTIVEGNKNRDKSSVREMRQQRIQRDREWKLHQMEQQQLRQNTRSHCAIPVQNPEGIGLPVSVVSAVRRENSLVKDKLREKLLPYKKEKRPETPMTPVEEMKGLQIRHGEGKGKRMELEPKPVPFLETVEEEPFVTMVTEIKQEPIMAYEPIQEPPTPELFIANPMAAQEVPNEPWGIPTTVHAMPVPAVIGGPVGSQTVNMNYDDFIDIRNPKQGSVECQGNIPNITLLL